MNFSSEREYEETGSEGEPRQEREAGNEIIDEENEERVEEEQEGEEMENHQRNHIGKVIFFIQGRYTIIHVIKPHNKWNILVSETYFKLLIIADLYGHLRMTKNRFKRC